jgi:hypothetical protein
MRLSCYYNNITYNRGSNKFHSLKLDNSFVKLKKKSICGGIGWSFFKNWSWHYLKDANWVHPNYYVGVPFVSDVSFRDYLFYVLKVLLKKFGIFILIFSLLQINIFYVFRSFWCTDVKNIFLKMKKNIILIHFWVKNILKSNRNHIFNHTPINVIIGLPIKNGLQTLRLYLDNKPTRENSFSTEFIRVPSYSQKTINAS